MTQTTVPTIRDTITNLLPPATAHDNRYLIDNVAAALVERERRIYGDAFVSDQPVTDEILRRLEGDSTDAEPLTKGQRIELLERQVRDLTAFARDNGYPL